MISLNITFGDEGIQERMATAPTPLWSNSCFQLNKGVMDKLCENIVFLLYCLAEDADGKRKAILLSVCGHETYQLIRNLARGAEAIKDLQYADMIKLITDYYDPPPSVTVQRFKFNSGI